MAIENNNKLIIRNTFFLAMRMVILLCISLYTSRVVLHVLGVVDYGIYNVVAGFVSMFSFLKSSMTNANQRYYNYELGKNGDEGVNNVYNTSLVIQACLAIVIVILTETVGLWYLYEKMVIPPDRFYAAFWIFQFSVISLVVVMFQIPYSAAVIAHEKMDYYAYVGIIDAVLKLLIALAIPYAKGDQLIVYGFLIFLISVVNWCLYFGYSRIHFKELKLHRRFHSGLFKGMLGFSAWNCFGIFSTIMREQGGNMMLNLFFGPVVNAARGIAYQVSGAMESVVLNVSVAARPQLVQSYAVGNTGRTINIMHGISKLCYLCILCVALPVIIEVDYVLKLWLGDVVPEHTNIFLVLVVMASLVRVFHPMTSHIVHATGKMRNFQVVNGVLNLLTLPIAYLFLYQGYEAYSIFVLFIIMNAVIQYVSWRVLHSLVPDFSVTKYLRQVILPLTIITALSIILPLLAHWGMESGFLRLMVVILLTVISTFITGYFIGINQSERELVVSYLRKFLKR